MPRPRILVVDDNREIVDLFLAYFLRRGFRLAWAYDGATALALAKVTRPDLLVLNYLMPGMNGVQVLEELRADPRTAGMKVIITSGHWRVRECAAEAGAQDFIAYPSSLEVIGTKVDKVLAA